MGVRSSQNTTHPLKYIWYILIIQKLVLSFMYLIYIVNLHSKKWHGAKLFTAVSFPIYLKYFIFEKLDTLEAQDLM